MIQWHFHDSSKGVEEDVTLATLFMSLRSQPRLKTTTSVSPKSQEWRRSCPHDFPMWAGPLRIAAHGCSRISLVRAKYVLTSCGGAFDDQISLGLRHSGWHNILSVPVLPRFEPVDGRRSSLVVRRPGSHIRLWKLA